MDSAPAVSLGRIVHYRLTQYDAEAINRRRQDYAKNDKSSWPLGAQAHVGSSVVEGDIYPLVVTKVWHDGHGVNGQVLLDGNDLYWATSRKEGEQNGDWFWPPRV